MNSPDLVNDACTLRNYVSQILVIRGHGMWDTENRRWHPLQTFLNTCMNVLYLGVVNVSDGRKPVGTGTINRSLSTFLSRRIQDHCLQKACEG